MSPEGISEQSPAHLSIDGAIATLTLNRPAAYNAIDISMARCLAQLAKEVEELQQVRVLLLRGAGKAFCAGGDISLFVANADDLGPPITELLGNLNDFLLTLRRMPQLVITCVHGLAAGAGLSLACMGDISVAGYNTRFRPAYAALGLSPDAGGSVGIVEAVGPRRALQLLLLEDEIDGRRAEHLGLVTYVVEEQVLEATAAAFAQKAAALSPDAVAATKRLCWQSSDTPLKAQLGGELHAILGCMRTDVFLGNISRFASRQK